MLEGTGRDSKADVQAGRGGGSAGQKQVGGWLLVLCLLLTIVNPVLSIAFLYLMFSIVADFPKMVAPAVLVIIVTAPLTCYSVYAGVALWKIKPGATATARNYLMTVLFCSIAGTAISFLRLIFSSSNLRGVEATFTFSLIGTILTIISVSIWHSYLNRSRRVGETYDEVPGNKSITLKLNR
jgi:hypothetical protein